MGQDVLKISFEQEANVTDGDIKILENFLPEFAQPYFQQKRVFSKVFEDIPILSANSIYYAEEKIGKWINHARLGQVEIGQRDYEDFGFALILFDSNVEQQWIADPLFLRFMIFGSVQYRHSDKTTNLSMHIDDRTIIPISLNRGFLYYEYEEEEYNEGKE